MRSQALLLSILLLAAAPAAAQRTAPRFLAFDTVLQGSGDAELRWPVSVAAGSALELAVADAYGARLVIFTTAGDGASRDGAGTDWTADHVVRLPAPPLAVVHDGHRYAVALRGRGDLTTVSPGATRGSLPLPEGTVPGALAAAPDGGLLVYDAAKARVLALDDAGRSVTSTPVTGRLTYLAAAPDDGFYAVFADRARVVRYLPDGRVLGDWQVPGAAPAPVWPDGLVALPSGALLIADRHAGRVVALDAAGRLTGIGSGKGWQPGRLLSPAGMTALPGGRLAVADRGNGRVQVFRQTTRPGQGGSPP